MSGISRVEKSTSYVRRYSRNVSDPEIITKIRDGSRIHEEFLLERAEPIIALIARGYATPTTPKEDLLQVGRLGVLRGARGKTQIENFGSFIAACARNAMRDLLRSNARVLRTQEWKPQHDLRTVDGPYETVANSLEIARMAEIIRMVPLNSMPRICILAALGVLDHSGTTLEAIEDLFPRSRYKSSAIARFLITGYPQNSEEIASRFSALGKKINHCQIANFISRTQKTIRLTIANLDLQDITINTLRGFAQLCGTTMLYPRKRSVVDCSRRLRGGTLSALIQKELDIKANSTSSLICATKRDVALEILDRNLEITKLDAIGKQAYLESWQPPETEEELRERLLGDPDPWIVELCLDVLPDTCKTFVGEMYLADNSPRTIEEVGTKLGLNNHERAEIMKEARAIIEQEAVRRFREGLLTPPLLSVTN